MNKTQAALWAKCEAAEKHKTAAYDAARTTYEAARDNAAEKHKTAYDAYLAAARAAAASLTTYQATVQAAKVAMRAAMAAARKEYL